MEDKKFEMKSMKIEPEMADKIYGKPALVSERPEYPYGLRISLDHASLEKLGVNGLPVAGSKVMIHAIAEVAVVSVREDEGGPKASMDLQIVEMAIEEKGEEKEKGEPEQEQVKQEIRPDAFYAASPEYNG